MLTVKSFNKYILIVSFLLIGSSLRAQQMGQYSQYMMNYFLINPAASGTSDNVDFRSGYRNQWSGIAGAPKNYYASIHMPFGKIHDKHRKQRHKVDAYPVIGAMFSGQQVAGINHATGYLSYSYHIPLSGKWMLSMGGMAGFNQISLDNLTFDDGINNDDAMRRQKSKTNFDASLGLWLYSDRIFVGLSSMQLFQNKVNLGTTSSGDVGVLNRHFYLTGGYKIPVSPDLKVIPSLLLKRTETALQLDVNTKVRYKDMLWGGVSYRRIDAVAFLGGVGIPLTKSRSGSGYKGSGHGNDIRLEVGYSYDLGTSMLRKYSGGSHEIMVGVLIPTGGRVRSPSDYW